MKPRLVKTNYEAAVDKNVCLTEAVDNIKGTGTAVLNGQIRHTKCDSCRKKQRKQKHQRNQNSQQKSDNMV